MNDCGDKRMSRIVKGIGGEREKFDGYGKMKEVKGKRGKREGFMGYI
jgi:hypothetical protein